jgi:HEAT repeat protein
MNRPTIKTIFCALGFVIAAPGFPQTSFADEKAQALAAAILDDGKSGEERQRLIEENPELAGPLVAAMAAMPGLNSEEEEYRRIPWIWRVAVAAGKRNDEEQLVDLLRASLPKRGEKLADWQAVVVGGGVINGVSLAGHWPKPRIDELLESKPDLTERWIDSQAQAAKMADDENVRHGTRYDALRMLALDGFEKRGEQLVKYLSKDVNGELQMGAVSALADIDEPAATKALIAHFRDLSDGNRQMALDGLVRGEGQRKLLLDAVESGRITPADLGPERIERLRSDKNAAIARRAQELLPSAP